jgi:DNA primase
VARWVSFKRVKAEVTIGEVLAHYGLLAQLYQRGDELLGRCPFHEEQEGSFRASLSRHAFRCFGCQRQGNVLDFVALQENITIRQAALLLQDWFAPGQAWQRLAARSRQIPEGTDRLAGDSVRPSPRPGQEENRPLGFALPGLDPTHPYLADRGLTPATIRHFGLGYCARGLLAGRIAIPIHDARGQLVAYVGRWPGHPSPGVPRYRFPTNFRKSRVVFNLHRARQIAKARDEGLVLVEGFFGVFRLHQAGYPNVSALMGSALSSRQQELLVETLGSHARVTLWFDADPAGRRCLEACRQALSAQLDVQAVPLVGEGVKPDHLPDSEIRRILG